MTPDALMKIVKDVSEQAGSLAVCAAALGGESSAILALYDNCDGQYSDEFFEHVHKFSLALTATVKCIEKRIDSAEEIADE